MCCKIALRKLNRALDHAALQSHALHRADAAPRAPITGRRIERDFRWHIEILPRLYFRSGVELATGCWLNSVWPEVAAAYLRSVELPA